MNDLVTITNGKLHETFERVDRIIDTAVERKDLEYAIKGIQQIDELQKLAGWGKAYLFYQIRQNWHLFGVNDDFTNSMVTLTNHNYQTITRYIRAWEVMQEAPVDAAFEMLNRNIGDSFPIGNAHAQGFEIESEDWDNIIKIPTASKINDYVREEVKEAEPRKPRENRPFYDTEDGTIYIVDNGEWVYVGSLDIHSTHPLVIKFTNRIIDRANLGRR